MPDEPSLFNLDADQMPTIAVPEMITVGQRMSVREAFEVLGITEAREQFEVVHQLTAQKVTFPLQLQARHAQMLIAGLTERILAKGTVRTGNAWDDRDEDTWIDKL